MSQRTVSKGMIGLVKVEKESRYWNKIKSGNQEGWMAWGFIIQDLADGPAMQFCGYCKIDPWYLH